MQFKNNHIFSSASDLIIFMESQFASHMGGYRMENPNYSSLMNPDEVMRKNSLVAYRLRICVVVLLTVCFYWFCLVLGEL